MFIQSINAVCTAVPALVLQFLVSSVGRDELYVHSLSASQTPASLPAFSH